MPSKAKTKNQKPRARAAQLQRTWPWRGAALALWLLAALVLLVLVNHRPSGTAPPFLPMGQAGLWLAGAGYDLLGLGVWWLVGLAILAGWLLWRGRSAGPLLPASVGCFWLMLALATGLGLGGWRLDLAGGQMILSGQAGQTLARGLDQALGQPWSWLPVAGLALAGLASMWWSLVLAIGPEARPGPLLARWWRSGQRPGERPVPSRPAPSPAPAQAPAQEPAVDWSRDQGSGPLIKPRTPPPLQVEPTTRPSRAATGRRFTLPPLSLLREPAGPLAPDHEQSLRHNSQLLEQKLADFGVAGRVVEVAPGPVVTMYEFKPAPGVKISKVAGLSDDLAMNLRAASIRIVAPIPGKAVIGIEIPNQTREMVTLREILASPAFQKASTPLAIALGKDILGQPLVDDLSRMPHLLIAGATGSGKSVFVNSLVLSLLYRATPEQVRLLMVDPKRIELSPYSDIPHLLYPIITEPKQATAGLRWALGEMERRYELLVQLGVRNIASYNQRLAAGEPPPSLVELAGEEGLGPLPYIVVIIDELADLMMVSSKEVEAIITRLAQKARAAGIHLVLATQRPSVDVITGLIKANFPARVSFQVSSRVDSRTILDVQGAEHLLGDGDMLVMPPGTSRLIRIHGAFVSDAEIKAVVDFLKKQAEPEYDESVVAAYEDSEADQEGGEAQDERYHDAVRLVQQTGQASISYVQRRLRVGYNRAARMIEQMEREGIVGPSDGSRPREVLIRD